MNSLVNLDSLCTSVCISKKGLVNQLECSKKPLFVIRDKTCIHLM